MFLSIKDKGKYSLDLFSSIHCSAEFLDTAELSVPVVFLRVKLDQEVTTRHAICGLALSKRVASSQAKLRVQEDLRDREGCESSNDNYRTCT